MARSPILDATAVVPPYIPGVNPYELHLGFPDANGKVLASTIAGARSWISVGAAGFGAQDANTVFAGPASGADALPAFRALVAADIPTTLRATTFTSPITLPGEVNGEPQIVLGSVGTQGGLVNALDNFYINSVPANGRIVFGRGRSGFTGGVEAMRIMDGVNIGGTTDPGATHLLVVGDVKTANLLTNAATFNLVNATPTTVNFAGAATALNIGSAASGITLLNSPTVNFAGTLLQPVTSYNTNIGSLSKKFLALHAAELWVETLVAQDTMATIGGRILVGPTTSLIADLSTVATSIDVKHNNLASGDRVYMESDSKVEFMAVTSGATGIAGGYRYSVTRNLDGTGANQWFAGDAIFNTGTTGSGFIDLYSLRGAKASSEVGPTIVGNVRNSATYNDWSARWAVGNLKGLYDYGTTIFGAAFGRYATAGQTWAAIDETNGFRVVNNVTPRIWLKADGSGLLANSLISWDTAGNLTVAGNATIGGFSIGSDYIRDNANSFGLASTVTGGDDVRFWAGNTFANRATAPFRLTEAGALVATSATITGAITASSGSITGLLTLSGASGAISLGTTPPSSATVGTGIWLDRTGLYSLLSNTQNATLTSAGLTAGGGSVTMDSTGLHLISGTTSGNRVSWAGGDGSSAYLSHHWGSISELSWTILDTTNVLTTGRATTTLRATGDEDTTEIDIVQVGSADVSFPAGAGYAQLGGGEFIGLTVGSLTAPAYMLDVRGDAKILTDLTIGGLLNPTAGVTISGGVLSVDQASQATPGLRFETDTMGWYRNTNNQWTLSTGGNTDEVSLIAGQWRTRSAWLLTWTPGASTVAADVGLGRAGIRMLEVNSSVAGTLGDLTLRNFGVGTSTFGTSAVNVIGLANGTVPSTSPADMVQLFSVDLSAGNATLGIRTETAVVTETVTSDRTLSVRINGATYKICLKV